MIITVFPGNHYKTDDLFQWDRDQDLTITGLTLDFIPEIHFTNNNMDRAIVRQASMDKSGIITVGIPNSLLQTTSPIEVYVCGYEWKTFKTYHTFEVCILPRKKPADYVLIDDPEVYSFTKLEYRLNNFNGQILQVIKTWIVNDLKTISPGKILDARQGKVLLDYLKREEHKVGSLTDLITENKTTIVNAINDIVINITNRFGDFTKLETVSKDSIVNIINEIKNSSDNVGSDLENHKFSTDHDNRYYTKKQIDDNLKDKQNIIDGVPLLQENIVDDLITQSADKPLSALQGYLLNELLIEKLNKNQGTVNANKYLKIDNNGDVICAEAPSGGSGGGFSGNYNDLTNKPQSLPNPHKLTFNGAVTGEYDGSRALTVTIPHGGSGAVIDTTLTQEGQSADAKITGDRLKTIDETIISNLGSIQEIPQPTSVNLFDVNKAEIGRYDASNGSYVSEKSYMTITLPYKHGDVIRKSKDINWFTTWILLCDADKKPIISPINVVPGNNFTNSGWDEWKMPEDIYAREPKYQNARYIKVSVSLHGTIKDFNQYMVTINNPIPDKYVPPVDYATTSTGDKDFMYAKKLDDHIRQIVESCGSIDLTNTTFYDGKTIVFVGDSIVQGLVQEQGASNFGKQHGFVEMLQAKYPKATFKNLAKGGATLANYSGATIPSVITQITNAISQYPNADYIIIQGGVNDSWSTSKIQLGTVDPYYQSQFDENTFCGALESIFKKSVTQWTGKKIGFITTHKVPSAPNIKQYTEKSKEICNKWSIPYLDMFNESTINFFLDSIKSGFSYHTANYNTGDGVHPNEKCYEQIYVPKVDNWLRSL